MGFFKEDLVKVKAFVFDVDGVFSKSVLFLHHSGDIMRSTNIKDGFAVQHAIKQGYKICIISGGTSESVRVRFNGLGVNDIYLGASHKVAAYEEFIMRYNLKDEEILYMGDDLPDYPVMERVGVPVCPADAAEEIKSISAYISNIKGGEGCVRDVIEQVMRAQKKWFNKESFTW
jgi:3-deoxy-D-manno-octulosonate 8-phosphate phosphatase (KDO 8-P phosphatase)